MFLDVPVKLAQIGVVSKKKTRVRDQKVQLQGQAPVLALSAKCWHMDLNLFLFVLVTMFCVGTRYGMGGPRMCFESAGSMN